MEPIVDMGKQRRMPNYLKFLALLWPLVLTKKLKRNVIWMLLVNGAAVMTVGTLKTRALNMIDKLMNRYNFGIEVVVNILLRFILWYFGVSMAYWKSTLVVFSIRTLIDLVTLFRVKPNVTLAKCEHTGLESYTGPLTLDGKCVKCSKLRSRQFSSNIHYTTDLIKMALGPWG